MITISQFARKMNNYKKVMRVLSCANYVFLDEIDNFEFKKISKYNKSKNLYDKITYDFKIVNELIDCKQDLLNAAAILRTLYENIIYIIAKSYDTKINITLNTLPKDLRKILEDHCEDVFTEYFKKENFNEIYKYLCKLVHPCSLKEFLSYIIKTKKYRYYLLNNLKYATLLIEYMYLNFLNKKVKNEESKFDLNFIDFSTYVNLVNVICIYNNVRNSESFIKKYFFFDTNNKYVTDSQKNIKEIYEIFINKKELVEKNVDELIKTLDSQIKENKYSEAVSQILSGK